jgi:hypothetical protein
VCLNPLHWIGLYLMMIVDINLATHPEQNIGEVNNTGVHGGEQEIRRDEDLINNKVDVQKLMMLTVKWWGDDGETLSEMI